MSNDSKQITHCDEMFPNQYIKAGELGENKVTYTIRHIEAKPFDGDKGKQWKGIATFDEIEQQWTINKTNMLCIKAMFGALVPAWYGKRVTLFPTKDRYGRDIVDCIRVWGSPDIERDIEVTIQHPKKKPIKMTMHKMGGQKQQSKPVQAPTYSTPPEAIPAVEQAPVHRQPEVEQHPQPAKFKFSEPGRKLLLQMRDTTEEGMMSAFGLVIKSLPVSDEEKVNLTNAVDKRLAQIRASQVDSSPIT